MAIDIMQLLFQALRIQELAYKYTNTVDQFLYLIFFPSLILIAIVYLFMHKLFKEHGKFAFLFTIAMFIFVIVYPPNSDKGLYTAIAPIGQFWFLGVAVIAVLWFLFGWVFGGFGGGGSGRPGGLPGFGGGGGAISGIQNKIARRLSGEEKDDERVLEGYLVSMQVAIDSLKKVADTGERAKLIEQFNASMVAANGLVQRITQLKVQGVDIGHDPKKYERRLKNLISEFGRQTGARYN